MNNEQQDRNEDQDGFVDLLLGYNCEYSVIFFEFRAKKSDHEYCNMEITQIFPEDCDVYHGGADGEDLFDAFECNEDISSIVEVEGHYSGHCLLVRDEDGWYWDHIKIEEFETLQEAEDREAGRPRTDIEQSDELPF